MKISLFASAVRPHLWDAFLDSLLINTIEFEVVFAGPCTKEDVSTFILQYPFFKYIHTGNIKPAQCYEIARLNCRGELVGWTADDVEYSSGLLDKIYENHKWNYEPNYPITYKKILSVKTNENNSHNDLNDHRFFGSNVNTSLMAPLGFMNRLYLEALGGLDRRYVCGQYENDIVMRALVNGAQVIKYENGEVKIDHLEKHGVQTKFWLGYNHDRKILEDTWVIGGYQPDEKPSCLYQPFKNPPYEYKTLIVNREVSRHPILPFEPFDSKDPTFLIKSQSHKGIWE